MSRTINGLADAAGMDPDEYVRLCLPEIPDVPDGPEYYDDRPREPATSTTSQHQRRRYAALRKRTQVR